MYAPCIESIVSVVRRDDGTISSFARKTIEPRTCKVIDEVIGGVLYMLYCNIIHIGGDGIIHFIYDPHIGMAIDLREYTHHTLPKALFEQIKKNIARLEEVQWLIDTTTGRTLSYRVQSTFTVD